MPPNDRNLILLRTAEIDRVAVMIRDPRDALVSWWRHLERDNIKDTPWIVAHLYASGLMSERYYSLPMEARFLDLIEHMFPLMQWWVSRWLAAIERPPSGIGFHLLRYEDFVADTRGSLRSLYRFFGHEVEPILPQKEGPPERMQAGIHTATHFRRGVPGSHRDEVPAAHVALLNERVDQALFERCG